MEHCTPLCEGSLREAFYNCQCLPGGLYSDNQQLSDKLVEWIGATKSLAGNIEKVEHVRDGC